MNSIQPTKETAFKNHGPIRATMIHPWLLTEREWDVVMAICAGDDTGQQVADRMNISPRTVQTFLSYIFQKLYIYTKSALIIKVINDPAARAKCFPHLQITEKARNEHG